jgi:hypothetical protein
MIFAADGCAVRSLAGISQDKGTTDVPCCGRPQIHLGRVAHRKHEPAPPMRLAGEIGMLWRVARAKVILAGIG